MSRTSTRIRSSNIVAAICLCCVSAALAQDAVPTEILQRTKLIRIGNDGGTAFQIDYGGKLYMVTARHVVAGLSQGRATVQIWESDKWYDVQITKTIYPASADVDIAVLETQERAANPFSIAPWGGDGGPTFGQQVWFLGYPFGDVALATHFHDQPFTFPFIKKGTMSAVDGRREDAVVLYIDGFNNRGFSGGPIIFWDFKAHLYKILGVVKGYRNDLARVEINGQQIDTNILVNSGILIGYSIKHAIQAIEADQK